ncbi:MAG: hypothetical protein FWB73_05340 [Treponema sp.]|nr:hypothetical protein [Treponema sp.]
MIYTALILLSCSLLNKRYIPDPDFSVYAIDKTIEIDNIIETKDGGSSAERMPEWLLTFIRGGNQAVEQLNAYRNKYVFVGVNKGENFIILNKWTENFTAEQDSAIITAERIEERIISTATLYPEYEYGLFFESLITLAYGTGYPDAVKEETYWFKISAEPETYYFFILITIDRNRMQSVIRNMMAEAFAKASPRRAQAVVINRLRQSFFEGF